MASLAQRPEVGWVAILGRVVEVGDCKYHLYPLWVWPIFGACLHHVGVILYATELTAFTGTFQYLCSYLFPILRITFLVFWSYRHIQKFNDNCDVFSGL